MRPLILVALVCVTVSAAAAASRPQRGAAADAVDLYGAGAFDLALQRVLSSQSLPEFTGHLLDIAKDQRAREGLDAGRLEPVALALGLEVVMAHAVAQPAVAVDAFEQLCARVRDRAGADAFAAVWHDAALSVLGVVIDPDALEAHLSHAARHYASDRARLNVALAAEQRTSPGLVALSRDPGHDAATAREAFAALADVSSLRAEVLLRLGRLDVAGGERDQGLEQLDAAYAIGRDPFVRYLARLFRGLSEGQHGEWARAERSFRDALAVRPGAQSATVALANALSHNDARRESGELLDSLVQRPAPAGDPWWSYWTGDVRFWLDRRDAMREATR